MMQKIHFCNKKGHIIFYTNICKVTRSFATRKKLTKEDCKEIFEEAIEQENKEGIARCVT